MEPLGLTTWRATNQANPKGGGINFGYASLRQDKEVVNQVEESLLAEQGTCVPTLVGESAGLQLTWST